MPSRSPFALVAIVLLLVSAFGGLAVGIPLTTAQLGEGASADPSFGTSPVPVGFLAYGIVSLVGALGLWLRQRWAAPLIVVSQGLVSLGLIAFSVAVVTDWSVLIVAAIAGGAAICSLLARRAGDA